MFLVVGAVAWADTDPSPGPKTALTAQYYFNTQDGAGSDWTTNQWVSLGFSSQWGQSLNLAGEVEDNFTSTALTADGILPKLYMTWNLTDWAIITFGKQRMTWGTAQVFSSIDDLQPVYDPLNPQAILSGVTGMKVEILPTDWFSIQFLSLPNGTLSDTKLAVRTDFLWNDTDLSAGAIRFAASGHNHGIFFADFAKDFKQFQVYGEGEAKNLREQDWTYTNAQGDQTPGLNSPDPDWVAKATLGLQVTIPAWLNGTITWRTEYHYDGEGFAAPEASAFATAVADRAVATVPQNLSVGSFSQHYGFTGLSGVPFLIQKLTLSASLLAALDTGFYQGAVGATLMVNQQMYVNLNDYGYGSFPGTEKNASDLVLFPQRHQVNLTVTGYY